MRTTCVQKLMVDDGLDEDSLVGSLTKPKDCDSHDSQDLFDL